MMKQIISRVTTMKKKCKEEFDHFQINIQLRHVRLHF